MFQLEFGNENVDGQTDVEQINLIGGLVTCNPPKKWSLVRFLHSGGCKGFKQKLKSGVEYLVLNLI